MTVVRSAVLGLALAGLGAGHAEASPDARPDATTSPAEQARPEPPSSRARASEQRGATGDVQVASPELKAKLKKAEKAFRYQNYERTIEILRPLIAQEQLPTASVRRRVLERLGASYWFTEARDAARMTFARLLKDDPDHELDPLFYPQPLIEFFAKQKERLGELGFLRGSGRAGEDPGPRLTVVRRVEEQRFPTVTYVLPFALGQFANGDRTRGTALAVLQGIGLALNVAAWSGVEAMKSSGGRIPRQQRGEANLLRGLWWAGSALFAASWGYSIGDGFANRPPKRSTEQRYEVLDPEELPDRPGPPERSSNRGTAPDLRVVPSQSGFGAGVRATF